MSEAEKACLYDQCKVYISHIDYELDTESFPEEKPNQEELVIKKEIVERMSETAQEILEFIWANPRLVDVFCNWGKIDQKRFTNYLRYRLDWKLPPREASLAFKEVRRALKEIVT